jgi:hypothetical protein
MLLRVVVFAVAVAIAVGQNSLVNSCKSIYNNEYSAFKSDPVRRCQALHRLSVCLADAIGLPGSCDRDFALTPIDQAPNLVGAANVVLGDALADNTDCDLLDGLPCCISVAPLRFSSDS